MSVVCRLSGLTCCICVKITHHHMAADAAAKRRRRSTAELVAERTALVDLRARLPFVSQSALAAVLAIAQKEKLPDIANRKDVRKSRDEHTSVMTPYGEIHQRLVDPGTGRQFEVQHPFSMLYHTCKTSPAMASLMRSVRTTAPGMPLSLVFYCDEITPGNQLSYKNQRKTWGFYWTVLEYGHAALSSEDARKHVNMCVCIFVFVTTIFVTTKQ